MFVHVCRTGQADIRTISVSHWGSELGLQECIYGWEKSLSFLSFSPSKQA